MNSLFRQLKERGVKPLAGAMICVFILFSPWVALSAEKLAIYTIYPGDMTNNEVYPALQYFKTLLEEKTGGAYDVEIFPGGELGSEVEGTRECQAGVNSSDGHRFLWSLFLLL